MKSTTVNVAKPVARRDARLRSLNKRIEGEAWFAALVAVAGFAFWMWGLGLVNDLIVR